MPPIEYQPLQTDYACWDDIPESYKDEIYQRGRRKIFPTLKYRLPGRKKEDDFFIIDTGSLKEFSKDKCIYYKCDFCFNVKTSEIASN